MMEFHILGWGLAISSGFLFRWATQRRWKEMASVLGLEYSGSFRGRCLQGRLQGLGIQIRETPDDSAARLVLEVHGVDPGFSLGRPRGLAGLVRKPIPTGDSTFDAAVGADGDEKRVLAVLDDTTRALVLRLLNGPAGRVLERKIVTPLGRLQEAPAKLRQALDLAHSLRRPTDEELPGLLSQRALEDSSREVCLRAFETLVSSYGRDETTLATAVQLRASRRSALRLAAARMLVRGSQDHGPRAAEELANLARRRFLDLATRREALKSLAATPFRATLVAAVVEMLKGPAWEPAELRCQALDALVKAAAKDELLAVELSDDPSEAETFAFGLARLRCAAGQPRLLELLDHEEDRVREAAAHALGAVGDLAAVGPLRQLTTSGTLFQSSLARAAESSILLIQARAGGAQAGEISLVELEPLEGAVSRAKDSEAREGSHGGEVSLA